MVIENVAKQSCHIKLGEEKILWGHPLIPGILMAAQNLAKWRNVNYKSSEVCFSGDENQIRVALWPPDPRATWGTPTSVFSGEPKVESVAHVHLECTAGSSSKARSQWVYLIIFLPLSASKQTFLSSSWQSFQAISTVRTVKVLPKKYSNFKYGKIEGCSYLR